LRGNGISLISSWGGKAARRGREGRGHAPRLTDGLQRRTLRLRPVARGIRGEGPLPVSKEKNTPPLSSKGTKRVIFRASRPVSLRWAGKKNWRGKDCGCGSRHTHESPIPIPIPVVEGGANPCGKSPPERSRTCAGNLAATSLNSTAHAPNSAGVGGELKYQRRAK